MDQLRKGFETQLKAKLSQKATPSQSEEALLVRNFRYFDTDNDGAINLTEWCRAVEKIGVLVPSKDDLKQLFSCYDRDNDGLLNCKEFANFLYSSQPPMHFPLKNYIARPQGKKYQ